MKAFTHGVAVLMAAGLLAACGKKEKEEQRITISIDAPNAPGNAAVMDGTSESGTDDGEHNVPDLLKQIVSRIEDVRPHIQTIMEDQKCRELVKARDREALSAWLYDEHQESLVQIGEIIGAKDIRLLSETAANHLIRKSEIGRRNNQDGGNTKRPIKRFPRPR